MAGADHGSPNGEVGAMTRDYFVEANRRLNEAFALLNAWIDDLKPDGEIAVRDRAIIARECVKEALDRTADVENAIRVQERPEPAQFRSSAAYCSSRSRPRK